MKEQIKTPEKNITKKWRDSQTIRCRVQNTGDQDAHRNGWVWLQNRGKSEDYTKWNKENIQGTNSEGKETRTQIYDLEQKEEINIQPEQNEETTIQKNEENLRRLWDVCKSANIRITGVPEEKRKSKKSNTCLKK